MLFAQMTKKEEKELKTTIKSTANAKWYRRLKIIDLSAQGHRVPELAKWFDVGEGTVRKYIKKYNGGGLKRLQPGEIPGRSASIPLSKEEWEDVLAQRPSQFKKLGTRARNWSQPLLCEYLYQYHQIEVKQGTISKTLKRQGISWKRAKKK